MWTAQEIIEQSDRYRGTFRYAKGQWTHSFPPIVLDRFGNPLSERDRKTLVTEFMEQLRANRDAVVEWLVNSNPDVRRAKEAAADRDFVERLKADRKSIVEECRIRARAADVRCYWVAVPGAMGDAFEEVPDNAVLLCVEREEWTRLPQLPVSPEEPKGKFSKARAKAAAKRKRRKNSPDSAPPSSALFADSGR